MRKLAALYILTLLALAGCESLDQSYSVNQNTVTGTGVGLSGFTFTIPDGYEIYDESKHGSSPIIEYALSLSESYLRSGNTPYKIPLIGRKSMLVVIPTNNTGAPGYTRVSDVHFQAQMFNFSRMNQQDRLLAVRNWANGVNVYSDNFTNVHRDAELFEGVPLGIFTATVSGDAGYAEICSMLRLGEFRDTYIVLGVGSPQSFGEEVYASKKLLASIRFDEPQSAPAEPIGQP